MPGAERQDIGPRSNGVPFCRQLFDSLRIFCGEIVHFAAILRHVVELPALIFFGDEFPFAIPKRTVSFVLPENRLLACKRAALKGGNQADAFPRLDFFAVAFGRIICARKSTQVAMRSTR